MGHTNMLNNSLREEVGHEDIWDSDNRQTARTKSYLLGNLSKSSQHDLEGGGGEG